MDRMLSLEIELKDNKISILRMEASQELTVRNEDYRMLLLRRSVLKDMLLEEYRNELLERSKDHEYISNS